ncbi:alpha/beta hydrolase [Butyrivibrio sp. AE2032]|uniref:alpha/beta hydrolase n=1 Tax=Butyrivibrio sp. AE2032 TaxID=1458463 RepID=UPI00054FFD6B|nr:alpha/beta hydrolase [Butyrivibrio sp. AE2032]
MNKIEFWKDGEYTYPLAFDFRPNLRPYLLDDGETHPCILVLPGGGYAVVVPPEGELVAKRFNELGYSCFVMTYTTNQLMREPVMEQAMKDLARAVRFVRKNASEYRIDPSKLYVCGFSAAGHVCGSLCDYWSEIEDTDPDYKDISCRPDAAILSYPVITSGEYAHKDSFRFLLGADIYDREDDEAKYLLDRYSLEKHVRADNPPCFVWQTEEDNLVPVKNSYLYADALKEAGVKYEHKTFPHGFHGLSVPNDDWAQGRHGEPYTAEQSFALVKAIKEGLIEAPEEGAESLLGFLGPFPYDPDFHGFPDVCVWPEMADRFLKSLGE